jgi:hypothetical protein
MDISQKRIFAIKPCPWCKKTPTFYMILDRDTWLPQLKCLNGACDVQPFSKYIPIRKDQKYSAPIIHVKIQDMIKKWNDNNPMTATEGIEFNFQEIADNEKKYQDSKKETK